MPEMFEIYKNGIKTLDGEGTTPPAVTGGAGEAINDNFIAIADKFDEVLPLDGGTMTGPLTVSTMIISGIATPSSPAEGQIYFNTSTKHWLGWDGTSWRQLDVSFDSLMDV